jgi:hypothetical protein
MTVVTTRITVAADGTISGRARGQVAAGEHDASITIADRPGRLVPGEPFDVNALPGRDLGPWPACLSLRREDLYADDWR